MQKIEDYDVVKHGRPIENRRALPWIIFAMGVVLLATGILICIVAFTQIDYRADDSHMQEEKFMQGVLFVFGVLLVLGAIIAFIVFFGSRHAVTVFNKNIETFAGKITTGVINYIKTGTVIRTGFGGFTRTIRRHIDVIYSFKDGSTERASNGRVEIINVQQKSSRFKSVNSLDIPVNLNLKSLEGHAIKIAFTDKRSFILGIDGLNELLNSEKIADTK